MSPAEWVFALALAVWGVCSLLRFVHMYDLSSAFQRFRRYDWFKLVPVGAFFGPEPPVFEYWILIRDVWDDGQVSAWTEVPRVRPRASWHALFNPEKQVYKARSSAARRLILASEQLALDGRELPPALVLSEPYLNLLGYVSALPRLVKPRATQFAVLETDIVTQEPARRLLSRVHEV